MTPDGLHVVKTGRPDDIAEELDQLRLISSRITPYICAIGWGSYTMQRLHPYTRPDVLLQARAALEENVWCIPQAPEEWVGGFMERFGELPPDWVAAEAWCVAHGDPTAGNTMQTSGGRVKLIDPKRPGRGIPSMRSVDLGKLLQSQLGWESVLVPRTVVDYDWALDALDELGMMRAVYWCRIHMLRIMQREEPGSRVHRWAEHCAQGLQRMLP